MEKERTTDLETHREKLMEEEAPDLPLAGKGAGAKTWSVLLVAALLGFAIPLLYIVFGLVGVFVATPGGLALMTIVALLAVVAAILGLIGLARETARTRVAAPESAVRIRDATVREVMTNRVIAVGYLDSVKECAKTMYDFNVGFVVVRGERDECAGVITDRDIVCAVVAQEFDPAVTPVTEIMERDVKSVLPWTSVGEALDLMAREGIRRLPVLDDAKCVGVLSIDDVILAGAGDVEAIAPVLRRQLAEPGIHSKAA
jgi:CBS domain-containing protein